MKLKTSVAAVILAFSATGAWAGPTDTGNSQTDLGTPDATAVQPSASSANEELQWKFVNGTSAQDSEKGRSDQVAKPAEQSDGDQSAKSEAQAGSDQAAAADEAATAGAGQAAASEQQSDDQSAGSEQAKSEQSDDSDQTANSEEQGEDQSAQSQEQDGNGQSANSDQPVADLKDKVVVIIPKDWKGSLPDLITALESSPDAKDIVIVQQGDPQASNKEPGDDYEASMKPAINQQ